MKLVKITVTKKFLIIEEGVTIDNKNVTVEDLWSINVDKIVNIEVNNERKNCFIRYVTNTDYSYKVVSNITSEQVMKILGFISNDKSEEEYELVIPQK